MPAGGAQSDNSVVMNGAFLRILFNPHRLLPGQDAATTKPQPTIWMGLVRATGNRQLIRIDPFVEEPHYHIRPTVEGGDQQPFDVAPGENGVEVALARFLSPEGFRKIMANAGAAKTAARVSDEELLQAVSEIRRIHAEAPAA